MFKVISTILLLISITFAYAISEGCTDKQCLVAVEKVEKCDRCHHCSSFSAINIKKPVKLPLPEGNSLKPFLEFNLSVQTLVNPIFRPPIS